MLGDKIPALWGHTWVLEQPQVRMRDTWWEGWLKKGVSFSITSGIVFPVHPKNEKWSSNVIKNLLYSVDPKSYLVKDGACQWYHCSWEGMKAPAGSVVLHLNYSKK